MGPSGFFYLLCAMEIILPTAFLPPVSYLKELLSYDEITIEISETYPKQTIRNHCFIYGPNGRQKLSVPVVRVNGNHTITKDIRISYSTPWQRLHWRSIETAYNNSPFFLFYKDDLQTLFEKQPVFLIDFNQMLLDLILVFLKSEKIFRFSEVYLKDTNMTDLRNKWNKDRLISITPYIQVFSHTSGFENDLSIIDLLFNLGPECPDYLRLLKI